MKRIICLILALSLCLSITACGSSGSPEPTEPDSWIIDTQYVTDIMTQFMASEDYQTMVSTFETAFHDANAKVIVQKPYVDAAIEYYMDSPACHLLILLVRGNFGWDDCFGDCIKIVYDIDAGAFYDNMVGSDGNIATRFPEASGTAIESLLFRPNEIYTTELGKEPLHAQCEVYHALSAEEIAAVNTSLGVEEPREGVVYEKLPTAALAEESVGEPVEDIPADVPAEDGPITMGGAVTVSEQALADIARTFQSTQRYQVAAYEPSSIRIVAAFEYTMPSFEGYDVHLLVIRVDGVDTDMWGMSADTFLVDISTGDIWHEGNLDMNWGGFTSVEECFACIISTSVWEADGIWSEDETRTALPQSMIDAANNALS